MFQTWHSIPEQTRKMHLVPYMGVARKFCRGVKQPAGGMGALWAPQWDPGAKPLEADKISTYHYFWGPRNTN